MLAAGGLRDLHEAAVDIKKMGDEVVDIVVVRHRLIETGEGLRPHHLGVFGGMTTKVDSTCRVAWYFLLILMGWVTKVESQTKSPKTAPKSLKRKPHAKSRKVISLFFDSYSPFIKGIPSWIRMV